MAKNKGMTNQLNNQSTFFAYFNQMISLAQNVFPFTGMPETIFEPYVNRVLLEQGSICFYIEPEIGLVALPFQIYGKLDIYNRPITIKAISANGTQSRLLYPDEYVICYDNTDFRSIIPDIRLYAQKMALTSRASDVNVSQQRTPRIVKGSKSQEQTIKHLYEQVDRNQEIIYVSKDFDLDDLDVVLAPAPYVADKLDEHADRIWNEFCRLIGISNIAENKKERLITSEVNALQAGAIASRWSRYNPRKTAVESINRKFSEVLNGNEVGVMFYDTEPDSNVITEDVEYV